MNKIKNFEDLEQQVELRKSIEANDLINKLYTGDNPPIHITVDKPKEIKCPFNKEQVEYIKFLIRNENSNNNK